MEIKGCEKLTDANVIIAYELTSENAKVKTKFHDALYGRRKDGLLFKIPHRKLARGVIEIPKRNLRDVKDVFEKYGVGYELRLTIPVRDSTQIVKIAGTIEDPYEKALEFDSLRFSRFIIARLEDARKEHTGSDELSDELLSIEDTMEKWVKTHREEPLATEFGYMHNALRVAEGKSPEEAKMHALRIAESLKHWTVGYQVLEKSSDDESIDDVLKKYKAAKK